MITLEEFSELLFVAGCSWAVCYIYDEESSLDLKAKGKNPEPLFSLCSAHKPSMYLKPIYAKAKVRGFCVLERNVLAVWIEVSDK